MGGISLNRGKRKDEVPDGVRQITGDIDDEDDIREKLDGMDFDVVSDFIAFDVKDVERDYRLFYGRTKQYNYHCYCNQ